MRRMGSWLGLVVVVAVAAGCRSLPKADDVATARTHIQTLRFEEPEEGQIEARAELVIYNPGEVKTYIDSIEATLYRGEAALGRVVSDKHFDIPRWDSKAVWLAFKDISMAQLEAAIGRQLTKAGAEDFEIEGVIVYQVQEGLLRHPFGKYRIATILGPAGSGM